LRRKVEAAASATPLDARARSMPSPVRRDRPLAVMHVITGLGTGGAEAMLYKLALATRARRGVRHAVVSLMGDGTYGPKLRSEDIAVTTLGMRQGVPNPAAMPRLLRLVRREHPDVLHTWMYHADLSGGVVGRIAGIPVVWGIHYADGDPRAVKPMTRWIRAACARLSGIIPARIVCCAESARRSHAALGYRADRLVVIPNGFAVERFAPSAEARRAVRAELALPAEAPVVGWVARFHPDKDPGNFLAAAAGVARARPDAFFLAMGEGLSASSPELRAAVDASGLDVSRLRLLGARSDAPRVFAALDVLASSSRREAFPNVLGEAMLSGVPCVTTDCGDCAEIVGPTGGIVPAGDPAALARALLQLLALPAGERAALGRAARERVASRYAMHVVADRYCDVYAEVSGSAAERDGYRGTVGPSTFDASCTYPQPPLPNPEKPVPNVP
jgi:glycosyltransferase involved in cell wall biosynthesis